MKSLGELIGHSSKVYSRRNRLFLPDIFSRILFLNLAIADLQEAVRKSASSRDIATTLARIVSRIFCCIEHYSDLPFVSMLIRKYPLTQCSYCHQAPCACPERRPHFVLSDEVDTSQLNWSLGEWCRGFDVLYGGRNRDKGIDNLLLRLFKEGAELQSIVAMVEVMALRGMTMSQIEEEIALEMADVMAWAIAAANVLEVDLEAAMIERYGAGCRKCQSIPCTCTHFVKEQLRFPLDPQK